MQAMLQQLDPRQFRLLLLGIGTVLTALAVIYAVVPPLKEYRAASKSAALFEGLAEAGGELDSLLDKHGANIDILKKKLYGDMANLPEQQVESYIIGELQIISWRNDIELVSVQPAAGESVQIFRETLFKVQLAGHYADLYRWMWETRNHLGFVVIKEYRLQRQDQNDQHPKLLADLSLASYRAER